MKDNRHLVSSDRIITKEDIDSFEAYFAEQSEVDQLWSYMTLQEIEILKQRLAASKAQFEEGAK